MKLLQFYINYLNVKQKEPYEIYFFLTSHHVLLLPNSVLPCLIIWMHKKKNIFVQMDSYNSLMIFPPSEIICCVFTFYWLLEIVNAIYFIFLANIGIYY